MKEKGEKQKKSSNRMTKTLNSVADAAYVHFFRTSNRSYEMLHKSTSFVNLWPNLNKQSQIQKLSASGSSFQPEECRCCYELRFRRGRCSFQTNTWCLSEAVGSKVKWKWRGVCWKNKGKLSCRWLLAKINGCWSAVVEPEQALSGDMIHSLITDNVNTQHCGQH